MVCAALVVAAGRCLAAGEHPIVYSTFLGGQRSDVALAIAMDSAGHAFIAGTTQSADFPLRGAWQSQIGGDEDVFLVKVDPNGRLLYSTYFGGTGPDVPGAIALDQEGNVWIIGHTTSTDLPTTPGALQPEYGGGTAFGTGDGFMAKFSSHSSELLYCSYFGGGGDETANGLAMDSDGKMVVSGTTDSRDFPGASIFGSRGRQDAFVAKLDPGGNRLLWSRIVAGSHEEEWVRVRCDRNNAVYFVGSTVSTNFPVTAGAQQPVHQTPSDIVVEGVNGFFGILDPDGSALRYLSFLGPEDFHRIYDLGLAGDGSVILTGGITTSSWSATSGAFQVVPGGGIDAFVARLRPPDWRIEWFTYLGGSNTDEAHAVALDSGNNVYVAGRTQSGDFPLKDSLPFAGRSDDAFLAKISADGKVLLYGTLLAGASVERAPGLVLGPDGLPVIAGATQSADFPVRNAFQTNFAGSWEAFVAKIEPVPIPIRPRLEIVRLGDGVIVSWPADAEGFVLNSASTIGGENWQTVSTAPLVLGSRNAVLIRTTPEPKFFRLKRP